MILRKYTHAQQSLQWVHLYPLIAAPSANVRIASVNPTDGQTRAWPTAGGRPPDQQQHRDEENRHANYDREKMRIIRLNLHQANLGRGHSSLAIWQLRLVPGIGLPAAMLGHLHATAKSNCDKLPPMVQAVCASLSDSPLAAVSLEKLPVVQKLSSYWVHCTAKVVPLITPRFCARRCIARIVTASRLVAWKLSKNEHRAVNIAPIVRQLSGY